MEKGDVVKVAFQQSDGIIKQRPALILEFIPPFNDVLVCGISSSLHLIVDNFDVIIDHDSPDFKNSGLKNPSLIRLGFLTVIPQKEIIGTIGKISSNTHKKLIQNLINYLKNNNNVVI